MKKYPTRSAGRTALVLTFIALLATVCIVIYVFLERRLRPTTTDLTPEYVGAEMTKLLLIVLGSILLIVIFVVGAYLFIRIGQAVAHDKVGGEPTKYVNVWGQYRLTDEQIDAATEEEPEDGEPKFPPDDVNPAS